MQYAKCDRNRVKGHSKEHTNKSYGEESKREQEKHLIEVGEQSFYCNSTSVECNDLSCFSLTANRTKYHHPQQKFIAHEGNFGFMQGLSKSDTNRLTSCNLLFRLVYLYA